MMAKPKTPTDLFVLVGELFGLPFRMLDERIAQVRASGINPLSSTVSLPRMDLHTALSLGQTYMSERGYQDGCVCPHRYAGTPISLVFHFYPLRLSQREHFALWDPDRNGADLHE